MWISHDLLPYVGGLIGIFFGVFTPLCQKYISKHGSKSNSRSFIIKLLNMFLILGYLSILVGVLAIFYKQYFLIYYLFFLTGIGLIYNSRKFLRSVNSL